MTMLVAGVIGRDIPTMVARGDLRQSSFGFIVSDDGEEWKTEGNTRIRLIRSVSLLVDVSPVTFPAYTSTTVATGGAVPRLGPRHDAIKSRLRILEIDSHHFNLSRSDLQTARSAHYPIRTTTHE